MEYRAKIDSIIPSFAEYEKVFDLFLNGLDAGSGLTVGRQRLILSEWLKFSLQLNVDDVTTRSSLTNLLFRFVSETQHSFKDYEHLLARKRQLLDCHGDLKDDHDKDEDMQDELGADDDADSLERQSQEVVNLEIRTFVDIGKQRDTREYLKPHSFEMCVKDSDDASQVAVMIIKKLMGSEEAQLGGSHFAREMLQIISDVREPLESKREQMNAFGDADEQPRPPTANEEELGAVSSVYNLGALRQKYATKFEEELGDLQDFNQRRGHQANDLQEVIQKARLHHAVLEEINLKEKLTIRRALTLCLILLKQCRASVADKTLLEICVALIQPALSSADDEEIQMLAIESIGLLGLLDRELFANYSAVFHAILEDSLRTIES